MNKKMIGTTCHAPRPNKPDFELMKEAGIEWVRLGISFPFSDPGMTRLTNLYLEEREYIREFVSNGFHVLLCTPLFGHRQPYQDPNAMGQFWRAYGYSKPIGDPDKFSFYKNIPDWMGDINDVFFYKNMTDVCQFIGEEFRDIVKWWQTAGEIDIKLRFAGPLTDEQCIWFMNASARGIKLADPGAKVGYNCANLDTEPSHNFFKMLYSKNNAIQFDYAGIDYYFGSYHRGSPEDWVAAIDTVYDYTHKPIIINEWGYSSIGAYINEPWPNKPTASGGPYVCEDQRWAYAYKGAHNESTQAEYIKVVMKIFADNPYVIGSFQYDWQDDAVCFCKRAKCPHECGFGLVDREGKPKESYYAFKDAVSEYY